MVRAGRPRCWFPPCPCSGAVLIASLRRKLSAELAGGLATTLIAGAFVASVSLFLGFDAAPAAARCGLFDWIHVGA
jgi:hypothetical protein